MRGSADTARIHDAMRCVAFLDRDIMRRNQTLEMGLEFTSNFPVSEMRAVRGPLLGMVFGRIFSQPILSSSSVAAFRGFNSDSTNGACFATSWHGREIIAPEVPHFHATFLNISRDFPSEGERCMKHTVHPIVHFSVHHTLFGRIRSRGSYAWHNGQIGRGQNTGLGWSDPTFVHGSVPKVIRRVAPAQLRGDRAECFVRAGFSRREPQ